MCIEVEALKAIFEDDNIEILFFNQGAAFQNELSSSSPSTHAEATEDVSCKLKVHQIIVLDAEVPVSSHCATPQQCVKGEVNLCLDFEYPEASSAQITSVGVENLPKKVCEKIKDTLNAEATAMKGSPCLYDVIIRFNEISKILLKKASCNHGSSADQSKELEKKEAESMFGRRFL